MSLVRDMIITIAAFGLAAGLLLGVAIRGSTEPPKPIVKSDRVIMPGERERSQKAIQAGFNGPANGGGVVYSYTPGQKPIEVRYNKQEFENIWTTRKPQTKLNLPNGVRTTVGLMGR